MAHGLETGFVGGGRGCRDDPKYWATSSQKASANKKHVKPTLFSQSA